MMMNNLITKLQGNICRSEIKIWQIEYMCLLLQLSRSVPIVLSASTTASVRWSRQVEVKG